MDAMDIDEEHHLFLIDEAARRAASVMQLDDVNPDDDDEYEGIYEERFHCGTCIVRNVMDEIWPAIEAYVDYLKTTNKK